LKKQRRISGHQYPQRRFPQSSKIIEKLQKKVKRRRIRVLNTSHEGKGFS